MMKIFGAIVTAAAITFGGVAHAALMDSTFGNTVTVTGADGAVIAYHFNADGTLGVPTPEGVVPGTWALTGVNLCITVGEATQCNDIDDRDVGDTWETTDENGTSTVSIIEGR